MANVEQLMGALDGWKPALARSYGEGRIERAEAGSRRWIEEQLRELHREADRLIEAVAAEDDVEQALIAYMDWGERLKSAVNTMGAVRELNALHEARWEHGVIVALTREATEG